jgi:hypothetical protein
MKFDVEKRDSVQYGVAYFHTQTDTPEGADGLVIVANSRGVWIKGEAVLESPPDFQSFAKEIGAASKEHLTLKPRLERLS